MSLNEKAYQKLLASLLSGKLVPGSMLTESQLVDHYALTLAPVRAALRRLSQEGWLIPLPRRGHQVKPLTIADIRDLFLMRKLIEPPAARMAASRIDTELLTRLDKICVLGFEEGNEAAETAFFEANKAFHVGIADAVNSRRISQMVRTLHDEAERVLRYGMRHMNWSQNWAHGHSDLLSALSRGDGPAAEAIAMQQLETSEKVVMDALMREAEAMPLPGPKQRSTVNRVSLPA